MLIVTTFGLIPSGANCNPIFVYKGQSRSGQITVRQQEIILNFGKLQKISIPLCNVKEIEVDEFFQTCRLFFPNKSNIQSVTPNKSDLQSVTSNKSDLQNVTSNKSDLQSVTSNKSDLQSVTLENFGAKIEDFLMVVEYLLKSRVNPGCDKIISQVQLRNQRSFLGFIEISGKEHKNNYFSN